MAEISTDMIKELRNKTQAGMMDCKKALIETGGDIEKATELLRKKGLAAANKQMGREASEGIVTSYIHSNQKVGVLLQLSCVTDFVAKTDDFQNLAKELCMQIAAANPLYVSSDEVPAEALDKEKDIYREQMKESGKPDNVIEKIVEGKIAKYYSEVCLLDQDFIKENKTKIKDLIKEKISVMGENIEVTRFTRYQIG